MDYETKLIQARLDAIEAILLNLASQDASSLETIRSMLSNEHRLAKSAQNAPSAVGVPTKVLLTPRPVRDTGGEAARTAAYERLCRKFGAPLSE